MAAGGYTCKDTVLGTALLNNFIYEWICCHGDCDAEVARTQLGEVELSDPNLKGFVLDLQQVCVELDTNSELRQLLDSLMYSDWSSVEIAFRTVVLDLSSSGLNMGRVAVLFYLTCQVVIKAILKKIKTEAIRAIISWTMSLLQEHVVNWIRERERWWGNFFYFGTPTWQIIGSILLAGILTTVLVIHKM